MSRFLEPVAHPAYDEANKKLMALFNSDNFSTAEQIAVVVYEVATDGNDQLRYVARENTYRLYAAGIPAAG